MVQVGINPNWTRWIWASLTKHFQDQCDALQIPIFIEGDDRDTDTFNDYVEFRMDGPRYTEMSRDFYQVWIAVNVLVCSIMNTKLGTHRIQQTEGHAQTMFGKCIPVYRYGDGPQDDGLQFGFLNLQLDKGELQKTNQFGQIEKTLRLQQATIEGHYIMDIFSSLPLSTFVLTTSSTFALEDHTNIFSQTTAASSTLAITQSLGLGGSTYNQRLTQSLSLTDIGAARFSVHNSAFANVLNINDSQHTQFVAQRPMHDTLSLVSQVSKTGIFNRSIHDIQPLQSDAVDHLSVNLQSVSSAIHLTDTTNLSTNASQQVSSVLAITQQATAGVSRSRSLSSVMSLSDVVGLHKSIVVSHVPDTFSLQQVVNTASQQHCSSSINLVDTATSIHNRVFSLSSALSLNDTAVGDHSRQVLSVSSSISLTDAVVKHAVFNRTGSDSASIIDSGIGVKSANQSLSSVLAISDVLGLDRSVQKLSVANSLVITDLVTLHTVFSRSLASTLTLTDAVVKHKTSSPSLHDITVITDLVGLDFAIDPQSVSSAITMVDTATAVKPDLFDYPSDLQSFPGLMYPGVTV